MPSLYPIQVAAKRTGLTTHVIRTWERRHQALRPRRTPTNRRLYSEDDLARLTLLGKLTASGHPIGQIAKLAIGDLRRLAQGLDRASLAPPQVPATASLPEVPPHERFITLAWEAAKSLDAGRLRAVLKQALAELGGKGFFDRVLVPLLLYVGRLYREKERGAFTDGATPPPAPSREVGPRRPTPPPDGTAPGSPRS